MKKRITLAMALILMAVSVTPVFAAEPSTEILAVVEDVSVTVQTYSFPANHTFHVYMGFNGTMGINGYLVSKLTTGEGGSFKAKFLIPKELAGEEIITIGFQSITDSKYYRNGWFYNDSEADNSSNTGATTSTHLHMISSSS